MVFSQAGRTTAPSPSRMTMSMRCYIRDRTGNLSTFANMTVHQLAITVLQYIMSSQAGGMTALSPSRMTTSMRYCVSAQARHSWFFHQHDALAAAGNPSRKHESRPCCSDRDFVVLGRDIWVRILQLNRNMLCSIYLRHDAPVLILCCSRRHNPSAWCSDGR
jgi:hypothetical protein